MKAVIRTSDNSAVVLGPAAGGFVALIWLFWVLYVLTAFVFIFVTAGIFLIVLWVAHDIKAYKIRKARRQARVVE